MDRRLLVNGMGMTKLNPITKMMAHLHCPRSTTLPIMCDYLFWHGTTFRSALTWNVSTTAVELVPSVPKLFSYYQRGCGRSEAISVGACGDRRRPAVSRTNAASTMLFSSTLRRPCRRRLKPAYSQEFMRLPSSDWCRRNPAAMAARG